MWWPIVPSSRQLDSPRRDSHPRSAKPLKWDENGELTSIDMARIIDRLTQPELNRCDLDTP